MKIVFDGIHGKIAFLTIFFLVIAGMLKVADWFIVLLYMWIGN